MLKLPRLILVLLSALITRFSLAAVAPAAEALKPVESSAAAVATAPATPTADVAAPAVDPFWPADGVFPVSGKTSSWSGFRRTNLRRRTLFAEQRMQDQEALVFFGDSITEGWKTLVPDFASLGLKIANRGIGGDTTPNAVYRLQDDVLSLHPIGMVVLIGTNDLGEHTDPAQIADNLKALLMRIRAAAPKIPIAWCLVMPRRENEQYPERIRDVNARIVQLAKSDPNSVVCDTFTPLAQADGSSKPEAFNPDRLHLNPTGYAIWREALLPILTNWRIGVK